MMKITSEKKGIFSHFIHIIWTKTINESHFHSMDSMFPLKVLVNNKSNDIHHKSVIAHFRL